MGLSTFHGGLSAGIGAQVQKMKLKNCTTRSFGVAASVVGTSAVEERPHQVVSRDGEFEIRDYPSMTLAQTTVDADRNSAAYAGFRLLAGYIFGGNAKKQRIDMTAPVIEAPPG